MTIKQLNPYLMFGGNAGEAMKLYERALGAKVQNAMRYGDVPGNQQPEANKHRVMHAVLTIGPGVLMMSDEPPGTQVTVGRNSFVCLDFGDAADMQLKFDALAIGGTVDAPLTDTFWGAKFGMLTDAFGVRWMFNCYEQKGM